VPAAISLRVVTELFGFDAGVAKTRLPGDVETVKGVTGVTWAGVVGAATVLFGSTLLPAISVLAGILMGSCAGDVVVFGTVTRELVGVLALLFSACTDGAAGELPDPPLSFMNPNTAPLTMMSAIANPRGLTEVR